MNNIDLLKPYMSLPSGSLAWSRLSGPDTKLLAGAAQKELKAVERRYLVRSLGLLVVMLAALCLWASSGQASVIVKLLLLWLSIGVSVLVSGVASVVADVRGAPGNLRKLCSALEPLGAHPHFCLQVLEWTRTTPAAHAYRDAVLAQGRELLAADYWCMQQMAQEHESAHYDERVRNACRQAHSPEAVAVSSA